MDKPFMPVSFFRDGEEIKTYKNRQNIPTPNEGDTVEVWDEDTGEMVVESVKYLYSTGQTGRNEVAVEIHLEEVNDG